jgi:hypothetical protein
MVVLRDQTRIGILVPRLEFGDDQGFFAAHLPRAGQFSHGCNSHGTQAMFSLSNPFLSHPIWQIRHLRTIAVRAGALLFYGLPIASKTQVAIYAVLRC